MPSPLSHSAVGYFINKFYGTSGPLREERQFLGLPLLLLICIGASSLPDFDFAIGIWAGNPADHHGTWTHSLFTGVIVSVIAGILLRLGLRYRFWVSFTIVLSCYEMHVVMDFFTVGGGIMMFWPILTERLSSPVKLFYGLNWKYGWISLHHIWALLTELVFLVLIVFISRRLRETAARAG